MTAYRIHLEDGNSFVTGMNATLEQAKVYYLGQSLNFGDTDANPADKLIKVVDVELLD